jgi:glycosyltransferase involved in cell wall biosynthesis
MDILYVFPEPLPLPRARGIQAVETVAALADMGVSVRLAYVPARDVDPFTGYGLAKPAEASLVPLTRGLPRGFSWLPVHSNRLFFQRLRRWLERENRRNHRPSFVLVRHLKIAHMLLDRFPYLPLLYEAHEVFADVAPPAKRDALARVEHSVLNRAKAVVAITRGAADDLKRRYRLEREIHVVPDAASWPARVPDKQWHEAARRIVYGGSFFPWKGVQDLVTAARWLPDCRITLIGGSPERVDEYRALVPANGAEVVFAGQVSHREALRAFEQACIAVLPNRAEPNSLWSSPLKLFEYMAAGCAVVASDLPPLREVLGEEEIVWVPPADPRALATGISRLVSDPVQAQRMGERLRARARNYTWRARAERLVAIMHAPG